MNWLSLEGEPKIPLPDMDCRECSLAGQDSGGLHPLLIIVTGDLSKGPDGGSRKDQPVG
jgi:hypothetical protein